VNSLTAGTNFDQGWYDNVIAVDPTDNNVVYVGGKKFRDMLRIFFKVSIYGNRLMVVRILK
jgi:hypothetical protein